MKNLILLMLFFSLVILFCSPSLAQRDYGYDMSIFNTIYIDEFGVDYSYFNSTDRINFIKAVYLIKLVLPSYYDRMSHADLIVYEPDNPNYSTAYAVASQRNIFDGLSAINKFRFDSKNDEFDGFKFGCEIKDGIYGGKFISVVQ